jgi:hypothetical protein
VVNEIAGGSCWRLARCRLTDQCLRETGDAEDYVHLLQSLLSFEGVEIWDRCLEGLQSGEYEVVRPYCGVDMFVVIGEGG